MKAEEFVRIHMEVQYTCSRVVSGWLHPHGNHDTKMFAIVGSLSDYLHDVMVGLPRRGDTEVHIDCISNRQNYVCIIPVVPEQLMSRRLGI